MPLGIITDEQLNDELNHHNRTVTIIEQNHGRGNKKETPESVRKIISEESINGAPSKELEALFKISPASISAYKNGATSTASYNDPDQELSKHVNKVKTNIRIKASGRLDSALEELTPERIAKAKARDIAGIAKDMSVVMRNMISDSDEKPDVTFNLFVPRMKSESEFGEVIDVSAEEE